MGLLPRGPEGLAPGADGGQKELRVGAQKEEAGIGGALLDEFEQDVLPRLVQQFRVLQEVDLPWRLVGQDVGVRPKGPDGLGLQPLPLRLRPDNVGMDPLGGLPAAGAAAAGGRFPGAYPGGGQLVCQLAAVLPHHQVGVGQLPLGHAGF